MLPPTKHKHIHTYLYLKRKEKRIGISNLSKCMLLPSSLLAQNINGLNDDDNDHFYQLSSTFVIFIILYFILYIFFLSFFPFFVLACSFKSISETGIKRVRHSTPRCHQHQHTLPRRLVFWGKI